MKAVENVELEFAKLTAIHEATYSANVTSENAESLVNQIRQMTNARSLEDLKEIK